MAIERQAVQGLRRVQATSAPSATNFAARQIGVQETSASGSRFLEDLVNAAGSLATVTTSILNERVEDDKVRQYNRALTGLMPTEDATVGGARAHMLVGLQNDIAAQTLKLSEDAQRFQGSDSDWEDHVINARTAVQDRLWDSYPELRGDKDSMRIVTNAFMEQQPKIFAARAEAKLKQESDARLESMESRIIMATQGVSGEAMGGMLNQLQKEALAMQISKQEFDAMVSQLASNRAAVGDDSLIQGTKALVDENGVSLYDRVGQLQTGEIQANRTWAAQNQVALFEKKDAAIKAFEAGELDRTQMLQIMQNHNELSGGTAWSDSEIKSLFDRQAKANASVAKMQDLLARGESGSPLGLQDISKEQRGEYASALKEQTDKLANDEIARTGATGEAAEVIRGKYEQMRYAKLGQQLIEDPIIKERYGSLMQMSSANLKEMTAEPEALQTIMRARDSIPEDARRAVMGDKEYAFVENYDLATRMGYTPGQAIEFAQNASRGEKLAGSVIKELNDEVDVVVGDIASGSWMTRGDNMSDMGRDLMLQEANTIARSMKVAGHNNDTIKRHLKSFLESQYTQLSEGFFTQGVLVKGDVRTLGSTIGVNQGDVPMALRQYMDNHKQELLDASGGMEESDLYFDVDSKRGMFTIRAGSGRVPVTPAMPLSEIKGQALLKERYEAEVKERDEAKKNFEAQHMRMWGAGGYQSTPPEKTTAKTVGSRGIADFLMSPAFASGENLPSNFEFNYKRNNMDFYNYVAKTENGANVGFDRVAGVYTPYKDAHGQSVGYGHFLTDEEKKNGYILIGEDKVPFKAGQSQLTPERAMRLLEQDMKSHVPSTSGWAVPFESMHPGVQRGLMDLSYNLGKGGIKNAPKAYAAFKAGKFTDGFIEMLSTASTEGKRSPGLLVRRAEAYNLAQSGGAIPKISEVETREDGSMYVKFAGEMSEAFVSKSIAGQIDKDGWLQVYPPKAGALAPDARIGRIKLS
jgi:GH24 family phage-related lysozyme (muramidase)|nr:MAG TPA: Lysozyme [Caudoviricetes sp.]